MEDLENISNIINRKAELPPVTARPGVPATGITGAGGIDTPNAPSRLRQWPVQLHLVNPGGQTYVVEIWGTMAAVNSTRETHRDIIDSVQPIDSAESLAYLLAEKDQLAATVRIGATEHAHIGHGIAALVADETGQRRRRDAAEHHPPDPPADR